LQASGKALLLPIQQTLRITPALAAGAATERSEISDMVKLLEDAEREGGRD